MRMCVPIIEKCELDKRCLPTEKLLPLKKKDLEYKEGTKMPTLHNISNDMYTAGMNKLDGKDFYGSYVVDTDNGHKVCNEVSKGIAAVSLETEIPVMFGVVTTDNIEQAIERAGSKAGNKGSECAQGAIEMINLMRNLEA